MAEHRLDRRVPAFGDTLQALLDLDAAPAAQTAVLSIGPGECDEVDYRTLRRLTAAATARLRAEGVVREDCVAVLAGTCSGWVAAALGTLRLGAVVLPLDGQGLASGLEHMVRDSGARVAFVDDSHEELARRLGLEPLSIEQLTAGEADPTELDFQPTPATTAVLFYTSGTTGAPKGVPLTHGNLAFQLEALRSARLVQPGDRVCVPLPLHHAYPFVVGMLAPLGLGLTLVLPKALNGAAILEALGKGRASVMIGVPRLYEAVYAGIEARARGPAKWLLRGLLGTCDLLERLRIRHAGRYLMRPLHRRLGGELRLLACGGAALEPWLAARLRALGFDVGIGYGLSETAPMVTLNLPGDCAPGSAGHPLPGVEVQIRPNATPDAPEGAGEVCVRGANVFGGYLNRPQETAEALDADGWFRTGDLGYFDRRGCLQLLGRASTLIVTASGKNIQPEPIEQALQQQEAVREAGILAREGRVVALVLPAGGFENAEAVRAAVDAVNTTLARYQRIGTYELTPEALPRTRLGKLRRHELEARYDLALSGEDRLPARPLRIDELDDDDQALLRDPRARAAWDILTERFPDRAVRPTANLSLDLGIDSLAWLDLGLELSERAGVALPEAQIADLTTVRELLEAMRQADAGEAVDPRAVLADPLAWLEPQEQRWLRTPPACLKPFGWLVYGISWVVMHTYFRLHVGGRERLPASGPMVFAPNHVSLLDPVILSVALRRRRLERTRWAGWVGIMFRNPLMRLLSRVAGVLPIDPVHGVRASLALAAATLRSGNSLVWFPEGERSRDGRLLPIRPGIGRVLEGFDLPVVPVIIEGAWESLPVGARWPRPQRLRVTFGEPVSSRELMRRGGLDTPSGAAPSGAAAEALTAGLHQVLSEAMARGHSAED